MPEGQTNIVKVKYVMPNNGGLSTSEYSYLTEEPLNIGDRVELELKENRLHIIG